MAWIVLDAIAMRSRVVALIAMAGCTAAELLPGVSQSAIITVDPNERTSMDPGKETFAAWTESADPAARAGISAVAFTSSTCGSTDNCVRWARSRTGSGTWEYHGDYDPAAWAPPSGFRGSDNTPITTWGPDPLILGVPMSGSRAVKDRFVYIAMAKSTAMQDIFIAVSDDGAQSFRQFGLVTANGGWGAVDRPAAAVDPINGTIWVSWASGSNYWFNSVTIPAAAGSAPVIGTPDLFTGYPASTLKVGHGLMAVKHDTRGAEVMFAWPDRYPAGDECPGDNSDASGLNLYPINWYLSSRVYNYDGSKLSWSHHLITSAAAGTFQTCVDPDFLAGGSGAGFYGVGSIPQIAYDRATDRRFVALAKSYSLGIKAPPRMQINVFTSTDETTWTRYTLEDRDSVGHQWRPTMALIPSTTSTGVGGKLAVGYYSTQETNPKTGGNVTRWASIQDLETGTWQPLTKISIATLGSTEVVPWDGTGSNGDYEGMAAELMTGTFLDAFPDNRLGGQLMVWAARFE